MKACLTNELSLAKRNMSSVTVESLGIAACRILFGIAIDLGRVIFLPHMSKANAEIKLSK